MPRMPNPNTPPCDCRWAERMADDAMFPIAFDAKRGEFHLIGGGGRMAVLYHCPFCGGSLPKVRRQSPFHPITIGEMERLEALVENLRTVADVEAALGRPDGDPVEFNPAEPGRPRSQAYRTLTYHHLFDTIALHVVVAPSGDVAFSYFPKPIRSRSTPA